VKATISWKGDSLTVDLSCGKSLAINIDPDGAHPSFFSDTSARSRPLKVGSFVGDMSKGGSCNAEVFEFSTHSHGTHTECLGHICIEHQNVTEVIDQEPTLMRLTTIDCDSLGPDQVIPASLISDIGQFDGNALAIRTRPNHPDKKSRNYDEAPGFPVLSKDAMHALSSSHLIHLLLDTPSADHPDSEVLENHASWWGLDETVTPGVPDASKRSITEMIFVPDEIPDGDYWLELQLPPLLSDAVPSRPVIYPLKRHQGADL